VNWFEAQTYLGWLTRKTGKKYRMLSEAEWEYAARAGTKTAFWWGSWITTSKANYDGSYAYAGGPKGDNRRRTLPVYSFDANPFGLTNIHGNVSEWVEDCWHPKYEGAPSDGSAWTTGDCKDRIIRGGSWSVAPSGLRAADRAWLSRHSGARCRFAGRTRIILIPPSCHRAMRSPTKHRGRDTCRASLGWVVDFRDSLGYV
jgi:formylglycine-generating enzyme required for sulfatase activity